MASTPKKRGAPARRKLSQTLPWYLRRKVIILVLGLVTAAFGFHCSKGRVIQVADGDTVVVHTGMGKTERVRLYGVDAPESAQRGGAEATAFASSLLLFASVSLSEMDRDQYGRSVALVRLDDGRLVNEEMVREGHAWVYRAYCREAFCAKWLALEHQAKKQGRGLWRQDKPTPPWQWRRANPRR